MIGFTGGTEPHGGINFWHSSEALHLWHPNQTQPATDWETEIDNLYITGSQELDRAKRVEHYHRAQGDRRREHAGDLHDALGTAELRSATSSATRRRHCTGSGTSGTCIGRIGRLGAGRRGALIPLIPKDPLSVSLPRRTGERLLNPELRVRHPAYNCAGDMAHI